jgi:hypothetical protein
MSRLKALADATSCGMQGRRKMRLEGFERRNSG